MVGTVQQVLQDTVFHATEASTFDINDLTERYVSANKESLAEDDIELAFDRDSQPSTMNSDAGLLNQLIDLMVRRLCDVQEKPARLAVSVKTNDDRVELSVRGNFADFDNQQLASFFAAAIPLKKWPIGLDMDLLASFLIAHHLGGSIQIHPSAPEGPSLVAQIPSQPPAETHSTFATDWFESVYASLERWQKETEFH